MVPGGTVPKPQEEARTADTHRSESKKQVEWLVPTSDPSGLEPVPSTTGGPADEPNQTIHQLEAILTNLTTYVRPVLREIAARAAESAAKAAEVAGPVTHRVAGMTDLVGEWLAAKGREIASEIQSERRSGPLDLGPPPTDVSRERGGASSS
jgi:hypothetical protein